ncbi:MAG: hypothetical protein IIX27_06315 [Ruminococcus sp.]|nr:hypothetical protein [Ruminococcus sp.]
MKISQLSDSKILITLLHDDVERFKLDFSTLGLSDPHSKKVLSRLCTLACASNSIKIKGKTVVLEALENGDGIILLLSVKEKSDTRKKYRIKRIKTYPCYIFENAEHLLCAIEKLCKTNTLFYNNSLFLYNNLYYLVFDYPLITKITQKILYEYAHKKEITKTFISKLNESAQKIACGNAIAQIGSHLNA